MNSEENIQAWLRIYESLTNPDIIAENKRKSDQEKRAEAKKQDTGITEYTP